MNVQRSEHEERENRALLMHVFHLSRARSARGRVCAGVVVAAAMIFAFAGTAIAQQPARAARRAPAQPAAKNSSPLVAEAETLLRDGHTDDAKRKIQQELGRNPDSVAGYNLLGIIYTSEKDYANAIDAFQYALKLDPNFTQSRNNLGNVYVALQKMELAEKEFRAVLRAAPANRDANYNLGLLLMAQGSPTKAILCFQRARPADIETRLNLTRAYFRAGRVTEGLKLATELSGQKQDDVQLHFGLGVLLVAEKQYATARLELEKANALQPEEFEILDSLSKAYLGSHDYAKAELALNRALNLKPDSAEALYLLAQVYSDLKRPMDALDLLMRAHKLAPQNVDIILSLARVSMSNNYFEDAIPLLQAGVKLAPQRADLHAALGESYFRAAKAEKAIEEFTILTTLDRSARSYALLGLSYGHLGRFDQAREYFQEGLKLDAHNASCLFNMGYIEERQGNHAAAEMLFQRVLREHPDYAEALLELANLRISGKKFEQAAELLRRYVKVSREPASGYYKLAMVERALHQTEAAERDLNLFQTLSKDSPKGAYPYQHLFDYLDNRASLSAQGRAEMDLAQLAEQIQKHPGQPQDLYFLAETYLKLGNTEEARKAIAQLEQLSGNDYRTQTGVGVLLARYRLYDEAIERFQAALRANSDSDDVKFDLADAYFRKGLYREALETSQQVSAAGQQDEAFLSLLGDIYAHLGDAARAAEIFRDAIKRNPDNDQYYLSLTLIELRQNDVAAAEETLRKGMTRIPGSGKIQWGLGLVSVLKGNTAQAAEQLERAVDLLPEWSGSYSTLGVFYYQTGQIDKAREVLNRFRGSTAAGLDVARIEEALSQAPAKAASSREAMPILARQQLLQLALSLAERTL